MEVIPGSPRRVWPRPAAPIEVDDPLLFNAEEIAWVQYWALLSRWWLRIAIVTTLTASATWYLSAHYTQKWYRANAVLTPVAKPLTSGSTGFAGSGGAGSLFDLLSGGSVADSSAQEYMSILKSFAFTVALAERHPPVAAFAVDANDGIPLRTQWELYNIVNGHFACDFNLKSGDLTLLFVAKTRNEAQRILGYYIDDLRDKLRAREVREAAAAVDSLREEINKTSDSLLQSQLYELMAGQVQRQKLAQVEADFAFTVIDPPVAPDSPYTPHPTRNSLLVIIFMPVLIFGALRLLQRLSHMSAEFRARTIVPSGSSGDGRISPNDRSN